MSLQCHAKGKTIVYIITRSISCRIDANFVIKITDFGLSEDIFGQNYFRQSSSGETVKLPVKWMAPESLSDGHFSEKSDVVCTGMSDTQHNLAIIFLVVIWSDTMGDIQWWEISLSWCGPNVSSEVT